MPYNTCATLENGLDSRSRISCGIAWPRRAAGHRSDITDNVIREYALPLGLVDVKVAAIDDELVLSQIVGCVAAIVEKARGLFEVHIWLAGATVGNDPGQLINMLFGNTSLHPDVALHDVEVPGELAAAFGGPRQPGIAQ